MSIDLGKVALDAVTGTAAGAVGGPIGMIVGLLAAVGGDVLPALLPHLAGPNGQAVAASVVNAASMATGKPQPVPADVEGLSPDAKSALQVQMATIAMTAEHDRLANASVIRTSDLAEFQASIADMQNARAAVSTMSAQHPALAWAPIVVSVVIVLAFGFAVYTTLTMQTIGEPSTFGMTLLGTLAAMATQVANYWLGSSSGSKAKDVTIANSVPLTSETVKAALKP